VVASDLGLGGFSGEWGDATPSVMRKKVELEEEGVIFDPKSGKIARSCLHSWTAHAGEEAASSRKGAKRTCDDSGSQSGAAEEGELGQARSKRRKQRSIASFFGKPDAGSGGTRAPTTEGGAEEGNGAAQEDDAAMHESLRGGILAVLRKRGPEKTC
jgi:hypothetical protein